MVAITLINPKRQDTILLKESPLAPDIEDGDVILRDCYQIPPRTLYKKLLKKWRKHV